MQYQSSFKPVNYNFPKNQKSYTNNCMVLNSNLIFQLKYEMFFGDSKDNYHFSNFYLDIFCIYIWTFTDICLKLVELKGKGVD